MKIVKQVRIRDGTTEQVMAVLKLINLLNKLGVVSVREVVDEREMIFRLGGV